MSWKNTASGYGWIHIGLHWVMAVMIAVLLPLGLWMTSLDYYDPWYKKGPDLHRAIGVILGLVLMARIAWRLGNPVPETLGATGIEKRLASATHLLLYLLSVMLVTSGYLISTADGRAVDVFGWFEIPATLYGMDGQEDIAGDIHFVLAMILLTLVGLHAGAALRHHFILKDDTLRRMYRTKTQRGKEEP